MPCFVISSRLKTSDDGLSIYRSCEDRIESSRPSILKERNFSDFGFGLDFGFSALRRSICGKLLFRRVSRGIAASPPSGFEQWTNLLNCELSCRELRGDERRRRSSCAGKTQCADLAFVYFGDTADEIFDLE